MAVAFSGMYVLAGFADKLRLMNLLIDDLKTFRELPVRNCSACAFRSATRWVKSRCAYKPGSIKAMSFPQIDWTKCPSFFGPT